MKKYTIDAENNIAVLISPEQAERLKDTEQFEDKVGLMKLTADWPATRLVEVWNGLPGVRPTKRFTSRRTATLRIWKALETLGGVGSQALTEAEQVPAVAPQTREISQVKPPTRCKGNTAKRARAGAPEPKAPETGANRVATKHDTVLALLKRNEGASVQELMDATGWQAHSVRGFLSGTIGKKMGLSLTSSKQGGVRRYSLSA